MSRLDAFYCDNMLGRLAKWLRLLGYDTAYKNEIDDWELLSACRREGRVLLTCDSGIVKRWQVRRGWVKAVLLKSNGTEEQLRELATALGLAPAGGARCSVCNLRLETLPRTDARNMVPLYVYETQADFHTCTGCRRVYWKATHWREIEKMRSVLTPLGQP